MHVTLKTLDKIKLHRKVSCSYACCYSEDQQLGLLCEEGVYIFELGCDSENRSHTFSFIKSFLATPQYSVNQNSGAYTISENVGININNFIDALNQYDVYESIMDVNVSQNLNGAKPIHVMPVSIQWSPKGLDKGQFCLLAVLSNTGILELVARRLYVGDLNEYYSACNITEYCVNTYRKEFKDVNRWPPDEQLAELKRRVHKIKITAFTWGHVFKNKDDNCCYLFCGHADGGITIWNICSVQNNDFYTVHNTSFKSTLSYITAMSWVNGGNTGLLIMGDLSGRISAVIVENVGGALQFDETVIYSISDNIKIESIRHFKHEEFMYIILCKGTMVIAAVFNADCEVLDQKLFQCGNLGIAGLEHYENNVIVVATYTGVVKQLELFYESNELQISSRDVCNDINWQKYRAHGLFLSHNNVFVGLVIHPSRVKDLIKVNQFINVVILKNEVKDPMNILLNNKTGSLRNYWDCLETLRIDGLKHKKYPCEKYPFILKLDYDVLSFLEIKTLFHISKITRVIYSRKVQDVNRNIESATAFAIIMQIKLAIKRMSDLVQQSSDGRQLTQFQMNSLELADSYLKETILGNNLQKFGLTKRTADEIYDLMAVVHNMEFPLMPKCFWCKNTITGLVCFPPHTDTRCAVSFMQITGPISYKCLFCKCAVDKSVVEEEKSVNCPFCDLPLQQTYFRDKLQDVSSFSSEDNDCCAEDCLKEEIDINNVEEEAFVEIDNFGYIPTAGPNWDQLSISDASTADESDIDYIYDKEVAQTAFNSKETVLQEIMDVE